MPFAGTIPHQFPHRSTGATLVAFGGVDLGYAEDRVMIDERPQWEDIRNDIFGGMAGIPSEVQFLGSVVYVQANLNRFNMTNIRDLSNLRLVDDTLGEGAVQDIGVFVRQGDRAGTGSTSGFKSLVLSNVSETLTFAQAFLRQGRKFNLGTRHQQFALVFECHINDPCDPLMYTVSAADDPCS